LKSEAALAYVVAVRDVEEENIPEALNRDVEIGTWMNCVASSDLNTTEIGLMTDGVVSEGFDALYDEVVKVCEKVMRNTPDILYVTESREDRVGYFTGRDSKVVYVPPGGEWCDPYYVSTLMDDPDEFCEELQRKFTSNDGSAQFSTLSTTFAKQLTKVGVGVNLRGLRYCSMRYGVISQEKFVSGVEKEKFSQTPILVRIEECLDFFESGSCTVVVDAPAGIGVYFSRLFVYNHFEQMYVNLRGFLGPVDKLLVVDIAGRQSYMSFVKMLRLYAYMHVMGTLFGSDKRLRLLASLKNVVSVHAWMLLAEMEWVYGDVVPDLRYTKYYLDKDDVECALRCSVVQWNGPTSEG